MSWNSGAERLRDIPPRKSSASRFSDLLHAGRSGGRPCAKGPGTARETGRFSGEGWRVRKDGTRFWASVVIDTIRDEDGELLGFAKVTRDITEREAAHESLLKAKAATAASSKR